LDILRGLGLDPTQFLLLAAVGAVVIILAYRPFIIGLFDPLNIFILSMCSNFVLMFGLGWDAGAKTEFSFFAVCLWLGFACAGRVPPRQPVVKLRQETLLELEIVLILVCALIVVANLYLGITAGFPLLSADPSLSKVTSLQGGLGGVRRLNMGPFQFLCCGCALFIALGHRRSLAICLLLISSALVALSGSKGALLPLIFVQAFVVFHKGLAEQGRYIAKLRKLALPSFGLALAVALVVVIRDNGGLAQGISALAYRTLMFGDVILFYYPRRGAIPEFMGYGFWNYVQYLLDPILGLLRLKEYSEALGTVIVGNLASGFGPNPQYFVRADIFFGPLYGCGYCLGLGYVIGRLRKMFFVVRTGNALVFTYTLMLAVAAFILATDSQLFVLEVTDATLLLCPLWVLAHLARLSATASHKPAEIPG
jgi:hypothetical protein